ncbi:MAG: hypothetical protein AVDCRST_MAG32-1075 [uncultured Nocardioides sp.]|uniref:Uncharacterized protein n=1 Tax=uncultured Nocardioides sp. TaxID=198441 RepID=A0A6J4N195_9ACTN|nr:MAG: hypothetical protein AVDCRST_MAG32-1075 [uncultured Nocardioides sp.]
MAATLVPRAGSVRVDGSDRHRLAAGDGDDLARDVARLRGGEVDERRRDLDGLSGPAEGHVGAEGLDLLLRHRRRDERRPDRAGRHGVHPDALLTHHLRETAGEVHDRGLRHGVVEQLRRRGGRLDRGGVDDGGAGLHVRQRHLAQPEHRVEVRAHHPVELLGGDVGDPAGLRHLVRRVVDEDVDAAELLDGTIDERAARLLLREVPGHEHGAASGVLDQSSRLLRVLVLALQVGDDHVGALAGEGQRDRPADPRVTARDDRDLVGEPVVADVALLAVVRLVTHLARDGAGRSGRWQLLALGVGLVVDLRGVLLGLAGGLVVRHGSSIAYVVVVHVGTRHRDPYAPGARAAIGGRPGLSDERGSAPSTTSRARRGPSRPR